VILVFLSFPIGSLAVPAGPISLQVSEFSVLVVAVLIALRRLAAGRSLLPWSASLWWLLALVAWALVGLTSAVDHVLALKQIASLLGGLLLTCVVLDACWSMEVLRLVLGFLVAVATGIAAGAFVNSGTTPEAVYGGSIVMGRAQSTFDDPNQLGTLCAIALLVTIGLLLGARSRRARVLAWGAIAVLTGGLLLSLSRGAWIGTATALLLLVAVVRQARWGVFVLTLSLIIPAAMLSYLMGTTSQVEVVGARLNSLTTRSPLDARPAIWQEAFREVTTDPWTGQGAGGFPVASTKAGSGASHVNAVHAHNLLLTWAAETGIPGALMIVGFCLSLTVAAGRAASAARASGSSRDRTLIACMGAALLAVFVQGGFDYVLRNSIVFLATCCVIGGLLTARLHAAGSEGGIAVANAQ